MLFCQYFSKTFSRKDAVLRHLKTKHFEGGFQPKERSHSQMAPSPLYMQPLQPPPPPPPSPPHMLPNTTTIACVTSRTTTATTTTTTATTTSTTTATTTTTTTTTTKEGNRGILFQASDYVHRFWINLLWQNHLCKKTFCSLTMDS